MKKMHTKRPGLTLVEIIFAFAIITTVLTLAYGSALSAWRSAASANQRTQAQYLAQQGLESIRAAREQNTFRWSDFITALSSTGGSFHMVLRQSTGAESASSFVCPAGAEPCTFEIRANGVGLNAIGSNLDPALATNSDSTDYTLVLRPSGYYLPGDLAPRGGVPPAGATNVKAVVFNAQVTWTSASGTPNSSLNSSTIISETE